jgi:membrane-associated progesterone receptor component
LVVDLLLSLLLSSLFSLSLSLSLSSSGGPYGVFAGRDASRGLAKMDLKGTSADVSDLSPSEKHTLKEWVDKFSSKYPIVGKIVDTTEPNSGSQTSNL